MLYGANGPVVKQLRSVGDAIVAEMRDQAPVDSSALRDDIHYQILGLGTAHPELRVGNSEAIYYADYVTGGTGIFGPRKAMIFPRHGRVMVFTSSDTGTTTYAQRTQGQRPNPYHVRALRTVLGRG